MKITIENTSKIVFLNGIQARIWEGETESGIKCICFINRIAVDANEIRIQEFQNELLKQKPPTPEAQSIASHLIL